MEQIVSKSIGLERGSSLSFRLLSGRLRSNSSRLLSEESISSECARVAGYERLSESIRMNGHRNVSYEMSSISKNKKSRALGFIAKVFSFRKISSTDDWATSHQHRPKMSVTATLENEEEKEETKTRKKKKKEEKKHSSWLPDPERRWPVQGW